MAWKTLSLLALALASALGLGWFFANQQHAAEIAKAKADSTALSAKLEECSDAFDELLKPTLAQGSNDETAKGPCAPSDPDAPLVPLTSEIRRGNSVAVTVFNRSDKAIDAVRFAGYVFDGFGERSLRRHAPEIGNVFRANQNVKIAAKSETKLCCWDVGDFLPAPARIDVTVTDVHFVDDSRWSGCGGVLAEDPRPKKRVCNLPWPEKCSWEKL